MTVLEFLLGGFAQIGDGHIEVQGLAGQRVIEVELDGIGLDVADDGDIFAAIVHGNLDLGADFKRDFSRKFSPGDIHEAFRVHFAVTIGRRNGHLFAVADFQAFQGAFEAGNDVPASLQEGDWAVFFGRVDNLAVHCQRVIHHDDDVVFDFGGFCAIVQGVLHF
jgi:hypothetical protein